MKVVIFSSVEYHCMCGGLTIADLGQTELIVIPVIVFLLFRVGRIGKIAGNSALVSAPSNLD